jgi:hypothetical protein
LREKKPDQIDPSDVINEAPSALEESGTGSIGEESEVNPNRSDEYEIGVAKPDEEEPKITVNVPSAFSDENSDLNKSFGSLDSDDARRSHFVHPHDMMNTHSPRHEGQYEIMSDLVS